MNRELMQRALDALKLSHQQNACDMYLTGEELRQVERSIFDLSAALAAPVAPAAAVVYPPDGTVSPFTVINLGAGAVRMGDAIHDGRLPALWFGRDGEGMGHEVQMDREAREGETLATVTFANVEGLDVLLDVLHRCRRRFFPTAAPVAPAGDKPATSEPVGYIDPETLAKLKPGSWISAVIIAARDAQWAARLNAAVRDERERLHQAVPEGCTPADAAVLRDANHALADESHRLMAALTAISTAENSAHALEYVKGIARSAIRARTKD